jgi:hypothetical protein
MLLNETLIVLRSKIGVRKYMELLCLQDFSIKKFINKFGDT